MNPSVMHVDIDAFFASVEQVRSPHLAGRPVIVGSGVIASCSYEARNCGLRAGMTITRAMKLCPGAVILEGHYPTYRCFSERVFEICRQIAPQVETHLDEAYCDLSGTDGLYGGPLSAGRLLKEKVARETGLTVSVGIASSRMMAKLASSSGKPDGLILIEGGDEERFLRDLPVEKLPGVGRSAREVLRKLNISTIGELRALDKESLQGLFGPVGLALHERCRGRDSALVGEKDRPKSISRETAFQADTTDTAQMEGMLFYLTERAARAMRALQLRCKTVELYIRYADSEGAWTARSLPFPTERDRDIFELARQILQRLYARRASVHAIGIKLSKFSRDNQLQTGLLGTAEAERLSRLYRCLDRLRGRFGHSVIVGGKSLDALRGLRRDRHGYILRTPCLTK